MKFKAEQIIIRRCIIYTLTSNYEVPTQEFAIFINLLADTERY